MSTPTRSWFQQLWSIPFNLGLEGMNYAVMNTITLIFNQYGKRLLKIDTDQIIASNECVDEFDVFRLHPLCFKESEQRFGPNVFRILSTTIIGLSISVPWKSIFTKTTLVSVDEISISLTSVDRADTIYYSMVEQELQSLFSDNKQVQHTDLLTTFREIKHMLQQYFNRVQFQIRTVTIRLDNCFVIVLEGIHNTTDPEHNTSVFSIRTVTFKNLSNDTLVNIQEMLITKPTRSASESSPPSLITVSVQNCSVNSDIVISLPVLFFSTTESTDTYKVSIETFSLDDLSLRDLELSIESNRIVVSKLQSVFIDQLVECKPNTGDEILTVLLKESTIVMHTNIDIYLSSIRRTRSRLEHLFQVFKKFSQKLISTGEKNISSSEPSTLQNLSCSITIPTRDTIVMSCERIVLDTETSSISVFDANISRNSEVGKIDLTVFNLLTGSVTLANLDVKRTDETAEFFALFSEKTSIMFNDSGCEIHFINAMSHNVVALYQYIYDLVNRFRSKRVATAENPFEIVIQVSDSAITLEYYSAKFLLEIKQGLYNITNGTITDLDLNVVMDSYLLLELNAELIDISSRVVLIRLAQILIDTDAVIRILNFTDNIVLHAGNDDNKNMLKSVSVKSVQELELIIVDEEPKQDLTLDLSRINVYIFDKLPIHSTRGVLPEPSIGIVIINAKLSRQSNRVLSTYRLTIESYTVSDKDNSNTVWEKVIIAVPNSSVAKPVLSLELCSNRHDLSFKTVSYSLSMKLEKHILNIREESVQKLFQTLLELYPGSTHDKDVVSSTGTMFRDVTIDSVQLVVNICPTALNSLTGYDLICIHNYKIKLSKIRISGLFSHQQVFSIISEVWDRDVDPTNIKQFIPNLQIVYLSNFLSTIKKYVNRARNKHRVKVVSRAIDHGIGVMMNWLYYGFMKLWNFSS